MENKIKYLEMIQGVINRMAGNSFMLKGWAVTLVVGILALADKDCGRVLLLFTIMPVIIFWLLDAYYLMQEQAYRELYDEARQLDEKDISFSLTIHGKAHTASDADKQEETVICFFKNIFNCFKSRTEIFFYASLTIFCIVIAIIR